MVVEALDPPAADLERADLPAQHRGGLDEVDGVALLRQLVGRGEAADPGADDDRAH